MNPKPDKLNNKKLKEYSIVVAYNKAYSIIVHNTVYREHSIEDSIPFLLLHHIYTDPQREYKKRVGA